MSALTVSGLGVHRGPHRVLEDIELHLEPGEVVCVVGRSGVGKSTLIRTMLGLEATSPALAITGRMTVGTHRLRLDHSEDPRWAAVRGRVLGWLPQSGAASLDPVRSVAAQLRELSKKPPRAWLDAVGLEEAMANRHVHELSGGQATRVALALAMAPEPAYLLADEPWTALDGPTTGALIESLRHLCSRPTGLLLVTHDLARVCATPFVDRVLVLDDGRFVEQTTPNRLLDDPKSAAGAALVQAARRDLGHARAATR